MEKNLEKEFNYYLEHQLELLKKYEGKYLIIKDQKVVEFYNTEIEAYTKAKEKYELGTFLIQQCLPGDANYKQTFHSRVMFA
ncbi:MAG: hypothetical protein HY963_00335 [Ignavibacteriales bacterium]|nr:hypothetical protein [Ignavibacteriales bacterium]